MNVFAAVARVQSDPVVIGALALVAFSVAAGILIGYRFARRDVGAAFDAGTQHGFDSAFESFSEVIRHKYAILTMMVLYEKTKDAFPMPNSNEALDNLWREIEYRYRHWVKGKIAEGPFPRVPDVPPQAGPTGAN